MAVTEKKSFCRVCGASCGIIVEVDGDRVVRVRGDEDHTLTIGYTCPKGRALPQHHHQLDRLEVPLIRDGRDLQATSWEHLLDDLGAKLKRIIAESGPRAVGMFIGGGGYLDACGYFSMRAVQQGIKTPSLYSDMSIDSVAKVIVSEMMCGIPGLISRPDVTRCKLVLYVGTNPMISHGHSSTLTVPAVKMRELTARGEVWVIDPRRTETAQKATRHLAPRPGTDFAILAFLIRELLREGVDHAYIAQHTQGVDGLRAAVDRFSLEEASIFSDVSKQDLSDLLMAVRRAGRLCIDIGTGVTMSPAGNVTKWLSWALMIITGSLDREGGAWVNPGLLHRLDEQNIPAAPETGWLVPGPESRPELRSIVGEYPCAAMSDEIEAGNLRALISFGGNLDACLPENERTMASLKKLEVLATIDVRPTETTEISTHILPAKDQLERADLTFATDMCYPAWIATQYTPAMVEPVGQRKAYWWMIGQLGRRMDIDFIPGIDPDTATDDDVLRVIAGKAPMSFEDIRSNRLTVAGPAKIGWLERYVDTKIGGWRLAPSLLVEQLGKLEGPAPLVLIPRRQKYHENSKFLELRDKPCIFVSPADAEAAALKDGATIEVRSPRGSLRGVMKIDPTLRAGAMTVPHGWSGQYNVNRLTDTKHVDSLTGMLRFSGLPVSLHLVDISRGTPWVTPS
jgi:anaerobic selenocysteine-containing dehydrogenase